MGGNKYSYFLFLLLAVGITACSGSKMITSAYTPEEITRAITDDRWLFAAHYALPTYGRSRDVAGYYDIKCRKDTLSVVMPYFGKSNTTVAPGSSESPLNFQSRKFNIKKEEKTMGEWIVTITPEDYPEVRNMIFSFFSNGSAQLSVAMSTRTNINFTGYVSPLK